jgi:hypothetical protein
MGEVVPRCGAGSLVKIVVRESVGEKAIKRKSLERAIRTLDDKK